MTQQIEPSGVISVMPQACQTGTPYCCSYRSIIARGAADPPTMIRSRLLRSCLPCSSAPSTASQTVGTPAVSVTRSDSISRSRSAGPGAAPGKTWVAPTIAAVNGMPQALTWNIGTTGITTSRSRSAITSGSASASECSTIARWL